MKVLEVVALTLIVAAVFMHFSFCCWKDPTRRGSQIVLFVYATSEFEDDISWAGVCGLVIPTLLVGGGVALALISHAKQKQKK